MSQKRNTAATIPVLSGPRVRRAHRQTNLTQQQVPQVETNTDSQEDIARLAYALWEERGRPEDSAEEDWLRAEQSLSATAGRG
jgi:hypothetical protein